MASKEEFTAGVAFASSRSTYRVLQSVYEGSDVVVWFPTGYGTASALYEVQPRTTWTPYTYSAFFIRILIYAFTVCYTVRYPDYLAHAHKYTYNKYQAS